MAQLCTETNSYFFRTVSRTGTSTDQNVICCCWCFLKKRRLYQTTGKKQKFFVRCRCFSYCYVSVSLRHFSHMSLPYLSGDRLIFSVVA